MCIPGRKGQWVGRKEVHECGGMHMWDGVFVGDNNVGIRRAGLARDERQVTLVVVGLQTHGGIVHATTLHIHSARVSSSVC